MQINDLKDFLDNYGTSLAESQRPAGGSVRPRYCIVYDAFEWFCSRRDESTNRRAVHHDI